MLKEQFLWGAASAACQMEGAYAEKGRTLSIADIDIYNSEHVEKQPLTLRDIELLRKDENSNFPKRRGNDFYHYYQEDLSLLAELGLKAYRFSISWSRIYPNSNDIEPNEEGLSFYEKVINKCITYGIEPIITLSHFDTPLYIVTDYGGWCNHDVIQLFTNYAITIFQRFKGKVKYWLSFNEINATLEIPFTGSGLLFHDDKEYEEQKHQALYHQFLASSLVTKALHKIDPQAKMGCMVASFTTYPETCHPKDVYKAMKENRDYYLYMDIQANGIYPNWYWKKLNQENIKLDIKEEELALIKTYTVDFISFSYYMSFTVSHNTGKEMGQGNLKAGIDNPYLEKTDWGWSIDPLGLRITMNEVYDRYHKPIMISENGFGAYDKLEKDRKIHDTYRIAYLSKHIEELENAIELDGVDCFAYLSWSPIDMISAGTSEMRKRYGYVYVDYDDVGNGSGKRYKKDSFDWYQTLIAANGVKNKGID